MADCSLSLFFRYKKYRGKGKLNVIGRNPNLVLRTVWRKLTEFSSAPLTFASPRRKTPEAVRCLAFPRLTEAGSMFHLAELENKSFFVKCKSILLLYKQTKKYEPRKTCK